MPRNLDLTALRAFTTVVDAGGVTKASSFLNITQSAVSMQIKRLEEALDVGLFDRESRRLELTASGEQLLSYARRILELNDEVLGRMTSNEFEGRIRLGVPDDIVYPAIPEVLRRIHMAYPRVQVQLVTQLTKNLLDGFERGEFDIILTTEMGVGRDGETLLDRQMVWVGAHDGAVWKRRPVRLAIEQICALRKPVIAALDAAGLSWELAVDTQSVKTIEATLSADLAISAALEGTQSPFVAPIPASSGLPALPSMQINLYCSDQQQSEPMSSLVQEIRRAFRAI